MSTCKKYELPMQLQTASWEKILSNDNTKFGVKVKKQNLMKQNTNFRVC